MHSLPSIPASRAAAPERRLRDPPIAGYINPKSNSSVSGSGSRPSSSSSSTKHKYTCIKDDCTREADKDSAYCEVHRPSKSSYSSSYSSSKKSYKTYDSYDDGYDAIYDDDDYDEDRYNSDPDYAAGADDAMDELDCYID